MRARPILFSAPMVRAILREIEQPGTGKTQTRRVLKQPVGKLLSATRDRDGSWHCVFDQEVSRATGSDFFPPRIAVGDLLYVREAWHAARSLDSTPPRDIPHDADIEHAATARSYAEIGLKGKLRPAMFLPRWASRITLIVEDVRVQRVQEISEADAIAEGIEQKTICGVGKVWKHYGNPDAPVGWQIATQSFQSLWDSLNAERAPWESNPWIAAYTFRPILGNIDQIDRRPA